MCTPAAAAAASTAWCQHVPMQVTLLLLLLPSPLQPLLQHADAHRNSCDHGRCRCYLVPNRRKRKKATHPRLSSHLNQVWGRFPACARNQCASHARSRVRSYQRVLAPCAPVCAVAIAEHASCSAAVKQRTGALRSAVDSMHAWRTRGQCSRRTIAGSE